MARLQANLARISRYKTDVLIVGERGSGKEQIARALTAMGPRAEQPFLPLYCATLDRDLLESELFGNGKSAPADQDGKRGLLELANGGTLFIDEIGELDLATQARLLRVLERGELRRAGGGSKIQIDLNVIAATRTDLAQAVAGKRFREDLLQRLRVATVAVPPLRERREDIPALAEALIADFNQRNRGALSGPDAAGARAPGRPRLAGQRARAEEHARERGRDGVAGRPRRARTSRPWARPERPPWVAFRRATP